MPRDRAVLQMRAQHRREQPRADDVVRLRTQVHREGAGKQILIALPAGDQLRRHRRRGPGVHHIGVADEAAGLTALRLGVALGHVGRGIDRQPRLGRHEPRVVVDAAVDAERIPHWKRHTEEALAADAPVAVQSVHPVLEPRAHVLRVPLHLAAARDERVALGQRLDEPLPAGDDLERPVALLEELHVVGDRPDGAQQIAGCGEQLGHLGLRLLGRQAYQLVIASLRPPYVRRFPSRGAPRHRAKGAVRLNHRANGQLQLAPPRDVGGVAERADHGDAAALLGISEGMRQHRHAHAEERRHHVLSEQRLIAHIVGMRHERHARRQELGPGRVDLDVVACPEQGRGACPEPSRGVCLREAQAMVGPGHLAVLEFGLGDGRLEVHVPQRGRFHLVGLAAAKQPQERKLRHALRRRRDGGVGHRPVDREPEVLPQVLEDLLVLDRERDAQLDEVRPRH